MFSEIKSFDYLNKYLDFEIKKNQFIESEHLPQLVRGDIDNINETIDYLIRILFRWKWFDKLICCFHIFLVT